MAFTFKRTAARLAAASLALLAYTGATQAQVTSGPGAWSSNQTWAADSVNGGNLTGYFYWPSTQPLLSGKRALVLVLHGCAQTASGDIIDGTSDKGFNWKTVADQYGAVILAPNATGNVSGSHCWDYSRTNHSRTTGHEGVLLDLIQRFVNNSQYAIDPTQVYVAGLSSGGGETMVLACLAPASTPGRRRAPRPCRSAQSRPATRPPPRPITARPWPAAARRPSRPRSPA